MTMIPALQPTQSDTILKPADAKAVLCVSTVLQWMEDHGQYNISEACRQTGVERWAFYDAYARPIVQGRVATLILGVDSGTAKVIESRWNDAILSLFEIAQQREDLRAAVQAVRLIHDIKKSIAETVAQIESSGGRSEASLLLEKMKGMPKTVRARRRITEETLEIEPD